MRVLRVGTSNDEAGSLPEEQRAWWIAQRALAEAFDEPVETILKRAWPNRSFAPSVAKWIEEYEPDMVVLQVNNFWYGHESVPLWLERKFGRFGAKVGNIGMKVGHSPRFTDNRVALFINRALVRLIPGATHFTVAEVATAMEAAMRRVLSREGVALLVRGNEHWEKLPMASRRANARNAARNAAMSSAMGAICDRLNVPYFQRPTVRAHEMQVELNGARWHNSAGGERQMGEFDGQAMVATWRAHLS